MNKAYDRLLELKNHVMGKPEVLCLLGLGSMSELARMDEYSDMDFFLIVEKGFKETYLKDLRWLAVSPISFQFKNTVDGYKVLFSDHVFAEFAVFEADELAHIGFTKGNAVYIKEGFDLNFIKPNPPKTQSIDIAFNVNEALTNIYVGLLREKRGEHASAFSFIQVHAANLIMQLFDSLYPSNNPYIDPYSVERRIESRYHEAEGVLSCIKKGYDHNVDAAFGALSFLKAHYPLNDALVKEIESLIYNG